MDMNAESPPDYCAVKCFVNHIVRKSDFATPVWYLLIFLQMEDVYQGGDGRAAMGALEGKLAAGQRRHQTDAFISGQAVIEFDGTCLET